MENYIYKTMDISEEWKKRIPARQERRKRIPVRLEHHLLVGDLKRYAMDNHELVNMRVVIPPEPKVYFDMGQYISRITDMVWDTVGIITKTEFTADEAWIKVAFNGTNSAMSVINIDTLAIPALIAKTTDSGRMKIKRVIAFVLYPADTNETSLQIHERLLIK